MVGNIFLKSKRLGVHPLGLGFDILLEAMPGEGDRYKLKFDNWKKLETEQIRERELLYEMFGKNSAKYISEIHAKQDLENAARDIADLSTNMGVEDSEINPEFSDDIPF